jgi:hypothetical protein
MASAIGGFATKVQVLQEVTYGGGTGTEVVFGATKKFTWNTDASVTQTRALECAGPQASLNVDGVLNVTGTHEWEIISGRELKAILGTETGGAGTQGSPWTLDVSNTLPSYCVKVVDESGDADDYLLISGIKYNKFTLSISRGNTVSISADWIGRKVEDTSTFSPSCPSTEPLIAEDCYFILNSGTQTELDSLSLDISREIKPVRFIEATTTGNRRLISKIIEGPLSVTGSGTITGQRAILNNILGGSSVTDTRSDVTAEVVVKRGNITVDIPLTGVRLTTVSEDLDKTSELLLMNFGLIAKDLTASIKNSA